MSGVQRHDKPTRAVYVTRSMEGDREFAGFGLPTHHYSDCFISSRDLPIDTIQKAQILVTGTLGLAYPETRGALYRATSIARASPNGVRVLIDVNWRPVFFHPEELDSARDMIEQYVMSCADIIKITDEEAEWLLGINRNTALKEPSRVAQFFPGVLGVLVTGGENGASFCFRDDTTGGFFQGYIPIFEVSVVDTTGAGDAFTGGFIAYALRVGGIDALVRSGRTSLHAAVKFACACGALTTQGAGAIAPQPSYDTVKKFIVQQSS
eukprot:TRINITY_DN13247_c0_g1_i1.p2 TRINITY_DN13247_c0_g1~~TRINITY_DN13247_c0_g1_i1.p2  ORF type:complete len:266 (+),score=31.73 TRINITY_DN13247_c0_g1_i1:593-1390(+)